MNRTLPAVLLWTALAAACTETTPARTFQVGKHSIEVTVPAGWQALDQGRQLMFRNGESTVIFTDLGAVRPEGFRDTATATRDLWRSGRDDEARTRLQELPLRTDLFDSHAALERIQEPLSAVLSSPRGAAYGDVAKDFDRLLAAIEEMNPPPIEQIVDDALPRLGHDESRREVKSRLAARVDDREAMMVETWMTLTHGDPRCLFIVVNAGRALALRSDRCNGDLAEIFHDLTLSLHFAARSRK
jgi:hypothetical protein